MSPSLDKCIVTVTEAPDQEDPLAFMRPALLLAKPVNILITVCWFVLTLYLSGVPLPHFMAVILGLATLVYNRLLIGSMATPWIKWGYGLLHELITREESTRRMAESILAKYAQVESKPTPPLVNQTQKVKGNPARLGYQIHERQGGSAMESVARADVLTNPSSIPTLVKITNRDACSESRFNYLVKILVNDEDTVTAEVDSDSHLNLVSLDFFNKIKNRALIQVLDEP